MLIVLCGVLIFTILLSNPRVSTAVNGAAAAVTEQIGQIMPPSPEDEPTSAAIALPRPVETVSGATAWQASAPAESTGERPAVLRMPQNRIPVRRAGMVSGN